MTWRIYQARWLIYLLGLAVVVGIAVSAVWVESEKLGATAAILGVPWFIAGLPIGLWSDSPPRRPTPEQQLPRAQRKELEKARADILLQKKIEQLEYSELGHRR